MGKDIQRQKKWTTPCNKQTQAVGDSFSSFGEAAERFGKPVNTPLIKLKGEIARFKVILENEIKKLKEKTSRWSFFMNFEIATKQKKLSAMTQLENISTLEELVAEASKISKDSRMMRSMKTSRTKDIINKIMTMNFSNDQVEDARSQSDHTM